MDKSIKNQEEIKRLKSQHKALKIKANNKYQSIKQVQREHAKCQQEIMKIDIQINKLIDECKEEKNVQVSDHAILRYLERFYNIDVEKIKSEILSIDLKSQILQLGDGRYPIGDSCVLVVKDNYIVTCISLK